MFEHLSTRANKAMRLSQQIAREMNLDYVGSEHVLLGVLEEGTGAGALLLKESGLTRTKIREQVTKLTAAQMEETWVIGRLPGTPHFTNVIAKAIEQAQGLGHNYVGPEHLLLGLLKEEGCVAQRILLKAGMNMSGVRTRINEILVERGKKRIGPPNSQGKTHAEN